MSEQQPFAMLVDGRWMQMQPDLSGRWVSFSRAFPRSGSMRRGRLYERPTPERRTGGSGSSSLLGTPRAADGMAHPVRTWAHGSRLSRLEDQIGALLPTPTVSDTRDGTVLRKGSHYDPATGGSHSMNLNHWAEGSALLPTPVASLSGSTAEAHLARKPGRTTVTELNIVVEQLPPTPAVNDMGDFGPYAAAVRRWGAVLGRPAPPPTVDEGNGPRLSARLVEWMMGLPEGWVTGVPGLSRSTQLRILGNGCVPQQCLLALAILNEGRAGR